MVAYNETENRIDVFDRICQIKAHHGDNAWVTLHKHLVRAADLRCSLLLGQDGSQDTSQSTQSMEDREGRRAELHLKLVYFDVLECNGVGYLNSSLTLCLPESIADQLQERITIGGTHLRT